MLSYARASYTAVRRWRGAGRADALCRLAFARPGCPGRGVTERDALLPPVEGVRGGRRGQGLGGGRDERGGPARRRGRPLHRRAVPTLYNRVLARADDPRPRRHGRPRLCR